MSEVVEKPLKRVGISRKLVFLAAALLTAGMIILFAWSEYKHNREKAQEAIKEEKKVARELADQPTDPALDIVLQEQKKAAEQSIKPQDQTQTQNIADLERELNRELAQPAVRKTEDAELSPDEIKRRKEEELAISAYGSEIVAIRRGRGTQELANRLEGLAEKTLPDLPKVEPPSSPATQTTLPEADMALLREIQRPAAPQTHQDRNRAFLASVTGKQGEIYVEPGRSKRVLHEGSIIPAVVARAINSDLPGQIELRTTVDVYDSVHARVLVIPRGTRVIGTYNADVNIGQDRVLATFHRLIFPDGRNVYLGNAQGADREGAAGFKDRVNTHFWKMLGSSLLLAAIARVAEKDSNTTINIGGTSYGSASNSAGQILVNTSQNVLGRYTNIPPTIEIRPGTKVNILVNRDIVL